MRIKNDPFPHIIIENYLSDEEYALVWREIEFLESKLKLPEEYSAAKNPEGDYYTDALGISLDVAYGDRGVSDILSIFNKKIFLNTEFIEELVDENEYWNCIKHSNTDYTKLRKYPPLSRYEPHIDQWVNALVSTTLEKAGGAGGDLFFPKHSYTIESEDNKTVIFPGWVCHGVTTLQGHDRYAVTKFIHCAAKM